MEIKSKFNFYIGLACVLCFIASIINQRDVFVIVVSGMAATVNLWAGFHGCED